MCPLIRINKKMVRLVLTVGLILLTFGCGTDKTAEKKGALEKWVELAKKSKPRSPVQRQRTIEEQKEKIDREEAIPVPERPLPTDKVTLRIINEDISVLLRALAKAANQNIMLNADVKGKININVEKTSWDQVFCGALATVGLTYMWSGDIIRVMSAQDMQMGLDLEKKQVEARELKIVSKALEPLVTKIIYIDYADPKSLAKNLEIVLSGFAKDEQAGGKKGAVSPNRKTSVSVDEYNRALIVTALKGDIPRLIALVHELDRPTPQVLIECNIVEARSEVARMLGVQWGGLYHGPDGKNFVDTTLKTPENLLPAPDPTAGLIVGYLTQAANYVLEVQLSALQEDGMLNILSSPTITTLDNKEAVIESGEEIPLISIISTGAMAEQTPEYKKAALTLKVTPHVIDGKMLRLDIMAKKDEFDFTREVKGYPVIITKHANTSLVLFNGQTTVIGGLTKDKKLDQNAGIPWAKDIPLLGYLFGAEEKQHQMDDLLIFITPHILKAKEVGLH
ncbi:MAG: secretin N-terminal domain-containing protein, partial [Pseudomonadota bacterium]